MKVNFAGPDPKPRARLVQADLMTKETKKPRVPASNGWERALAAALIRGSVPGEVEGFTPAARRAAAVLATKVLAQRKAGQVQIDLESFAAADGRRLMRIAIAKDNMPFLVDSVAAVVARHSMDS